MSIQRSVLLVACAGTAVVTAIIVFAAQRAPAGSAQPVSQAETVAKKLIGHWAGAKFGAEANRFRGDRWDVIFDRVSGAAVIGRKRHRENGRWTAFERLDVIVDSARHIWAVDSDGDINGSLRANGTLELVYQEPGTSDAAAAIVHLKRS